MISSKDDPSTAHSSDFSLTYVPWIPGTQADGGLIVPITISNHKEILIQGLNYCKIIDIYIHQ